MNNMKSPPPGNGEQPDLVYMDDSASGKLQSLVSILKLLKSTISFFFLSVSECCYCVVRVFAIFYFYLPTLHAAICCYFTPHLPTTLLIRLLRRLKYGNGIGFCRPCTWLPPAGGLESIFDEEEKEDEESLST